MAGARLFAFLGLLSLLLTWTGTGSLLANPRPNSIRGQVRDKMGVAPAAPVRIRLTSEGSHLPVGSGSTEPDGHFLIDGIRPGDYILEILIDGRPVRHVRISHTGFDTVVPLIHLDRQRQDTTPAAATVDWRELRAPRKAQQAFDRGVRQLARNLPRQSIRSFRRAVDLWPPYCSAYLQWALAHFELGDVHDALDVLEHVHSSCEENPLILALRGKVLLEENRIGASIEALSRAIALDDRIWNAQKDLCEALIRTERFEQAYDHAREAHLLRPNSPESHVLVYRVLAGLRRYAEALEELDEIIDKFDSSPVGAEARTERGRLLRFLGKQPPK